MGRCTLLKSKPEDFEFLKQVHHSTLKKHIAEIWGWNESDQDNYFKKDFENCELQVILYSDQKIGYLQLNREPGVLSIVNLLILPEFQGLGLGSEILRDLIDQAKENRLSLRLGVFKVNTRARKLYEKLEFQVDSETETHFLMQYMGAPRSSSSSRKG